MHDDIQARVTAIIAEQAGRAPAGLGPGTTLEVLGMDSIALVEAIFALEEEFDISVPFNANTPGEAGLDLSTLGAIAGAVAELVAARAA
jgi:acyl carrier protein